MLKVPSCVQKIKTAIILSRGENLHRRLIHSETLHCPSFICTERHKFNKRFFFFKRPFVH